MSTEGKIIAIETKFISLLEKELKLLNEVRTELIQKTGEIIVEIGRIPEESFAQPNRKTLLATIFSKINKAIEECDKQTKLVSRTIPSDYAHYIERLRENLEGYKKAMLESVIHTKKEAVEQFRLVIQVPTNRAIQTLDGLIQNRQNMLNEARQPV